MNININAETIRTILSKRFSPHFIEVLDESGQHQGHPEAKKSGGGHYRLVLVSDYFEGKSLLERHRAVYETLGTDKNDSVHALAIRAFSVREWLNEEEESISDFINEGAPDLPGE